MAESDMVEKPYDYFRQFIPGRSELLQLLETEAEKENIPIIGPVVGQLINILVRITAAKSILELGTATGYSAIFMAEALDKNDGRILTLEFDPDMALRAKKNLKRAGLDHVAEIRRTDAVRELSLLEPSFDMIFIDIEKEDYVRVLPDCHRLLKKNGLLVADNVGFRDADAFNRTIASSREWNFVSILSFLPGHSPELDGLCLAVKL